MNITHEGKEEREKRARTINSEERRGAWCVRTLLLGEGGEGEASGQAGVVGQRVHRQGRHGALRVCELCEGQDGAMR